jgi:hypothetical protein
VATARDYDITFMGPTNDPDFAESVVEFTGSSRELIESASRVVVPDDPNAERTA